MSIAINRDEIKELVFLGLGEARQGVPAPWHPYFPGKEWATKHTEFDRDEANKMLDALGLTKRDAQGIRLMANGKPATIEISVVPGVRRLAGRGAACRAGTGRRSGIKTVVQIRERALHFKMNDANELMASIWNEDTTAFPFTGNAKFDPRNHADPDAWAALHALADVRRQRGRGADRADQADHAARRYGAHRGTATDRYRRRRSCSASGRTTCSRSARSG